jgi:hypothetical protein
MNEVMMGRQCAMIDDFLFAKAHAMLILTYLPAFITAIFRGMPGVWKSQYRLLLCNVKGKRAKRRKVA